METLSPKLFATAKSGLPSALKSPTATEVGASPAAMLAAALKESGHWASAGIVIARETRAAIQRGALMDEKRLPKVMGWGVGSMDWSSVVMFVLLQVVEIVFHLMTLRDFFMAWLARVKA